MKVLLALVLSLTFTATMADDSKKVGEVSAQAVDCEKILAAQGAKAPPAVDAEDAKKDSTGTVSK